MRTVEFKLSLNQSQQAQVDDWLNVQRWVWNRGLEELEKFDTFCGWDKISKSWVPRCPVPWEYYQDKNTNQLVPFCRLPWDYYRSGKKLIPFCHIAAQNQHLPQEYQEPQIQSPTFFGLGYYFAQKNHPDKPWFCEVPSKFVFGTLKSLSEAWQQYKSGDHKRPKYKGRRHKISTLVNNNAKSLKISGKKISIPKLGKVSVKTLDKRWDSSVPISTLKILKEASGYYLQLTGDIPIDKKPLLSDKAVGLATGIETIYTTDSGKVVEPPMYYRKIEKRLKRFHRQASRQQEGSANQRKTYQKIARLHERTRRTRRAFNHKLSTYLVEEYGAIAINQKPGANGARTGTEINKALTDNAQGQLLTLIEQKAQIADREFAKVPNQGLPSEQPAAARAVLTTAKLSFARNYRPWGWEVTPGESSGTLNQEPPQGGPPCDAGTASKSTSETTNLRGLMNFSEATSAPQALSQQQTESSVFDEDKSSRATSQSPSEIETSSNQDASKQLQKGKMDRSRPNSENQALREQRRSTVENDSS